MKRMNWIVWGTMILAMVFMGCQNPNSPSQQTGNFFLALDGVPAATTISPQTAIHGPLAARAILPGSTVNSVPIMRTILPGTVQDHFALYVLEFFAQGTTVNPVLTVERTKELLTNNLIIF